MCICWAILPSPSMYVVQHNLILFSSRVYEEALETSIVILFITNNFIKP